LVTNVGTPSEGITGLRRLAKLRSASKTMATVTGSGRALMRLFLLLRDLIFSMLHG
jgi:hypothetical protein